MRIKKGQLRRIVREELVLQSARRRRACLTEEAIKGMNEAGVFSKIAKMAGPIVKKAGPALKKGGKAALKFAKENPEFVEQAAAPILQKAQEKLPILKDMGLTDVESIKKALQNPEQLSPDHAELIAKILGKAGPKLEDAVQAEGRKRRLRRIVRKAKRYI